MPQLSVIVPVYRVLPYLSKCIDSILAQTFTDFELILVDDGSPDRCGAICDEYAAKDDRIVVIHQKNAGVSAARNAGLDIAQGRYLSFIDSDDWIDPNMFRLMLESLWQHNADLVACGIQYWDSHESLLYRKTQDSFSLDRHSVLQKLFGQASSFGLGCCNKIFLRERISDLRFPIGIPFSEDWEYLYQCSQRVKAAFYLSNCLYNVLVRENSATRTPEISMIMRNIQNGKLFKAHLKLAKDHGREIEAISVNNCLDDYFRYSNMIREAGKRSGQKWLIPYIRLRCCALQILVSAIVRKLLPKKSVHRYLYECFRLS